MSEIKLIEQMIFDWQEEFADIKETLVMKSAEANSVEYNLLATEALRLSMCISDIKSLLLHVDKNTENKV